MQTRRPEQPAKLGAWVRCVFSIVLVHVREEAHDQGDDTTIPGDIFEHVYIQHAKSAGPYRFDVVEKSAQHAGFLTACRYTIRFLQPLLNRLRQRSIGAVQQPACTPQYLCIVVVNMCFEKA